MRILKKAETKKEKQIQSEDAGQQEKEAYVVETVKLPEHTAKLFRDCIELLQPPPKLTLSEWADMYRVLSPESSAEPGRWHTDKAPYQREIMDTIGSPHTRKVVIMSAAQIGKTAMLMNMLGYYMHY